MTAFPIKLPSRGVVEASASPITEPSVIQQPEAARPALRAYPALVALSAKIVGVRPYIDLVDGHGHIVVAHGVTVYDNGWEVTSPLVTLICSLCDDVVVGDGETAMVTGTVTWCRVNGNSRYGYEPYHVCCLEADRLDATPTDR